MEAVIGHSLPALVSNLNMAGRWPLTDRVGLALILIGTAWFAGCMWWAETRIWAPLDEPVSLSRGHIRTPEFEIDVETDYLLQVWAYGISNDEDGPGQGGLRRPSVVRMSWSLSNGERVVGSGNLAWRDRMDSRFHAGKGRYTLDVDVWDDGSFLNAVAPRLVIVEIGNEHGRAHKRALSAFILFLLLTAVGVTLAIRSASERRHEKLANFARAHSLTQPGPQPRELQMDSQPLALPSVRTGFRPSAAVCIGAFLLLAGFASFIDTDFSALLSWLCTACIGVGASLLAIAGMGRFQRTSALASAWIHSGTAGGHYRWKPRPSHRGMFTGLPSFGLMAAIVYLVLMLVAFASHLTLVIPKGLIIHIWKSEVVPYQSSPWTEPLLVRLALTGRSPRPNLYLNRQPESWDELGPALAKELSRRPPHFPVYVEGDPDMDWGPVVNVVDIIRGLHAEVILLKATRNPAKIPQRSKARGDN